MGSRYFLEVVCPKCGTKDDAYYAPTCGITHWTCHQCGYMFDLEALTNISYEEASNLEEVEILCKAYKEKE